MTDDRERALQTEYGGFWQELRAFVAVKLMSLALRVHFRCTVDLARALIEIERVERRR